MDAAGVAAISWTPRNCNNVDNPDVVTPGSTVYYISQGALSAALELNKSLKVSKVSMKAATPLAVSKTFKGKFSPGQGPMLI